MKQRPKRRIRQGKWGVKKIILYVILPLLLLFTLSVAGGALIVYTKVYRNLPDVMTLKNYKPNLITEVYDDDGKLISEFYIERRVLLPLNKMPPLMKLATIAVEDDQFYKHKGFNFKRIVGAMWSNIKAGGVVEGGSTITQQITKTMFLTPERTLFRKLREAILATRIEENFSKDEILEIYLNQIYYGHSAYGVEAAALVYFGRHINELSLPEMAIIAALPRSPKRYSPYLSPENAKSRRNHVLRRMESLRFITSEEAERAAASDFKLKERQDRRNRAPYFAEYIRQYVEDKYGSSGLYKGGLKVYTTLKLDFQEAAEYAVKEGLLEIDKRLGYRGSLGNIKLYPEEVIDWKRVEDIELKNFPDGREKTEGLKAGNRVVGVVTDTTTEKVFVSLKAVDPQLDSGDTKGVIHLQNMAWAHKYDPSVDALSFGKIKNAKEVLKTGDIIDVRILEEQGARGKPAPASSKQGGQGASGGIKLALEQEPLVQGALLCIDPSTGFVRAMVGGYDFERSKFNRSIQSQRQPGSAFKPIIYSASFEKGFTPASIFIDSPVIFEEKDEENWKPANFEEKFYGPTTLRIALTHSRNVITVKLLQSMGVKHAMEFARRLGIKSYLTSDLSLALGTSGVTLLELTSAYGVFANKGMRTEPVAIKTISDKDGNILEENKPFTEKAISEELSYITTNILQSVVQEGTGWRAKALGRPVAGKTGTTNNYMDAWFVGYTPDIVAGVWVGMDRDEPVGKNETGARAASPLWVSFMERVLKKMPVKNFQVPAGIVFAKVDKKTGLLATPETSDIALECFLDGTEPTEFSEPGTKTGKDTMGL
ncbi:MAG: PBP1A family penicillin-binding protein [Nitrospinae bacterium]|nr:PBP1A family penicillin-binding protein [Nitrospinota bacterium]